MELVKGAQLLKKNSKKNDKFSFLAFFMLKAVGIL
jgi:hypothetical protein